MGRHRGNILVTKSDRKMSFHVKGIEKAQIIPYYKVLYELECYVRTITLFKNNSYNV